MPLIPAKSQFACAASTLATCPRTCKMNEMKCWTYHLQDRRVVTYFSPSQVRGWEFGSLSQDGGVSTFINKIKNKCWTFLVMKILGKKKGHLSHQLSNDERWNKKQTWSFHEREASGSGHKYQSLTNCAHLKIYSRCQHFCSSKDLLYIWFINLVFVKVSNTKSILKMSIKEEELVIHQSLEASKIKSPVSDLPQRSLSDELPRRR